MINNQSPIGIFDSGIGGLSVFKEIRKILPDENLIYFGDTARVPYGNKSKETIIKYSKEIAGFLIKHNIKIIVIACNTVSSIAIDELKAEFDLPIFGVIYPAAMSAYQKSNGKTIAVIGTVATINSKAYSTAINSLNDSSKHINIIEQACPLLVPLVEEGWVNSSITSQVIRHYLKHVVGKKPSCIVLGCTHYPFIKNLIAKEVGEDTAIIDSGFEVASDVEKFLTDNDMLNTVNTNSSEKFFVTDDPNKFKILGENFLNRNIAMDDIKLIKDFL